MNKKNSILHITLALTIGILLFPQLASAELSIAVGTDLGARSSDLDLPSGFMVMPAQEISTTENITQVDLLIDPGSGTNVLTEFSCYSCTGLSCTRTAIANENVTIPGTSGVNEIPVNLSGCGIGDRLAWHYYSSDLEVQTETAGAFVDIYYKNGYCGDSCTVTNSTNRQDLAFVAYGEDLSLHSNLVGYWTFDDTNISGSNPTDVHSQTFNGTTTGALTGATGMLNEAFNYTGGNDYVLFGELLAGYTNVTMSLWYYRGEDSGNYERVLAENSNTNTWNTYIGIHGTTDVYYWATYDSASHGNYETSTTSPVGTWEHLVYVRNTSGDGLYVNGTLNNGWNSYSAGVLQSTSGGEFCLSCNQPGSGYEGEKKIDELGIWARALNNSEISNLYASGSGLSYYDFVSTPSTPSPSDHKTETTTKQQQTTNVSLNSNTFTSIYSYTFAPANTTQFYQYFTVPVNPTQNNALECKIQVDGADLGSTFSRTNTAGQIGQLLIKSDNTSLNTNNHTVDLQCRRSSAPAGAMTIFDVVGTGHLLFDQASGETIPYTIGNFTNSTTSGASLVNVQNDSFTSENSDLTDMEHHLVLEYVASITNNGGSAETITLRPYIGGYECADTIRTISSGGTGSVGGTCINKNVTNNTAYPIAFKGNGTNTEYQVTYDIKELYLHDEDINTLQIDWNKGAETGWNKINNVSVQQDLGAGQDLFGAIGISQQGSGGNARYELRLTGDGTENSTEFIRLANSDYGVLGVHNTFENHGTGNYSIELWAEVTSLDDVIGELIGYETGKQIITENIQNFNARTNITNTSLSGFSIWIDGNQYSTAGTTIELPNLGVKNITYAKGGYNNKSYANINTTASAYIGYLCQVNLYFPQATNTEGGNVNYPFNISYLGNITTITSNNDEICVRKDVQENLTWSKNGWFDTDFSVTKTTTGLYNETVTNVANLYMDFVGTTPTAGSGKDYDVQMQCSDGGSYLNKYNTNYYTLLANTTLSCDEGTEYPAFNQTITLNTFPTLYNKTAGTQINVTEYRLSLTFDTNTTGNVTWTHDTDANSRGQYPLINTSPSNSTFFEWIKIKANWSDNTLVKVTFNELLAGAYNSSAQYYVYRNNLAISTVENMKVLDQLDGTLWANVQNYAQEELLEATIRVEYCPTLNGSECELVTQVLTEPQGGEASPGTAIYLDTTLDYWVHITKTGYEPQALLIRGLDLIDDEVLDIKLKPLYTAGTRDYYIYGPKKHHNNTALYFQIAYGGDDNSNYYYNTTYLTTTTQETLRGGADLIILNRDVHYENNTDFTLYLWVYNGSLGQYVQKGSFAVTYEERDYRSIIEKIGDNSTLRAMLWIFLIILASVMGTYVTRDGLDTGYYIFTGGVFLLSIVSSMFIPVAVVMAIILLGGTAFSVSRE